MTLCGNCDSRDALIPEKVGSSAFSHSGRVSVDNQLPPLGVVSPASSAFFSSYHCPNDDILIGL
jgi:hypothetical protein